MPQQNPASRVTAEWLTPKDTAALLHVSERTLYEWRRSGTLPASKLGAKVLYSRAKIEARLAEAEAESWQ